VRLSIDGALVQRVTRNAIIWFPGNFGWSPANVGTESLHGVEARATLSHGPIDVSVWGTAYDPELTSGSLRIPTPYVPAVAGGAVTRAQLGVVQVAASSRWLGPRPFTAGPRDPAFTLPTVFLLDLTTSTRRTMRGRDLLLAASLDNATNRAWQSVRGFPAPGRSWSVAITIRP
jgi:outer membrane cobalamin receptor